jgi:hypothetical protein
MDKKEAYQILRNEVIRAKELIEDVINNYDGYINQIKEGLSKLGESRIIDDKDFKKFMRYNISKIVEEIDVKLSRIAYFIDNLSILFSVTKPVVNIYIAQIRDLVDFDTRKKFREFVDEAWRKNYYVFYINFGNKIDNIRKKILSEWGDVVNKTANKLDDFLIKYFLEYE